MNRYYLFRRLMDLLSEEMELTNAAMVNYAGDMEISGQDEGGRVTLTVKMEGKE